MKLAEWQKIVLSRLREADFQSSKIDNLTLLAYFFYDDERIETQFFGIECSILSAYRACGKLPTVLVVNKQTQQIRDFAQKYGVDIQVDPSLTGGLAAMNLDCNGKLYSRFETEYVLVVESDGMMLNPGIEKFLGKWDYVGAPWKITTPPWFLRPFKDYLVGNSGFCLRSKEICEEAARLYNKYFRLLPYNWFLIEDVFYCKTLRWFFPSFCKRFKFPNEYEAGGFSLEKAPEYLPKDGSKPIGFHGQDGFDNYVRKFGLLAYSGAIGAL